MTVECNLIPREIKTIKSFIIEGNKFEAQCIHRYFFTKRFNWLHKFENNEIFFHPLNVKQVIM